MKLFVTFKGFDRGPSNGAYLGPPVLHWSTALDEQGNNIGELTSNKSKLTEKMTFRKGNRYQLICHSIINGKISRISKISGVKKIGSCNLIELANNGYRFKSGKYKGKFIKDLPKTNIVKYLTYIKLMSNNEATIRHINNIKKTMT